MPGDPGLFGSFLNMGFPSSGTLETLGNLGIWGARSYGLNTPAGAGEALLRQRGAYVDPRYPLLAKSTEREREILRMANETFRRFSSPTLDPRLAKGRGMEPPPEKQFPNPPIDFGSTETTFKDGLATYVLDVLLSQLPSEEKNSALLALEQAHLSDAFGESEIDLPSYTPRELGILNNLLAISKDGVLGGNYTLPYMITSSNRHTAQFALISAYVPAEYMFRPETRAAALASFHNGEFNRLFSHLMNTIASERLGRAMITCRHHLAKFEFLCRVYRSIKGRPMSIVLPIHRSKKKIQGIVAQMSLNLATNTMSAASKGVELDPAKYGSPLQILSYLVLLLAFIPGISSYLPSFDLTSFINTDIFSSDILNGFKFLGIGSAALKVLRELVKGTKGVRITDTIATLISENISRVDPKSLKADYSGDNTSVYNRIMQQCKLQELLSYFLANLNAEISTFYFKSDDPMLGVPRPRGDLYF